MLSLGIEGVAKTRPGFPATEVGFKRSGNQMVNCLEKLDLMVNTLGKPSRRVRENCGALM